MKRKKNKKKKRKLNKKRFLLFFIFLLLLFSFICYILNVRIKNIYISGNINLIDQEIIDLAGIKDYPKSINSNSYYIKNKLEKSDYILSAKVYKKSILKKVYIDIKENYPLFYYLPIEKTILYDGTKIENDTSKVIVLNTIPNTIYDEFLEQMKKIDIDILNRMSEIKYSPNEVDSKRFFILMNDGNYVYITLNKFLNINKYIKIIKSFDNNKGILYLDSGEYFDIFDK